MSDVPETPFLSDLHGRFGISRHQVVRLAEQATGREVDGVERLVRGYDNEVYRVSLLDDSVVYVRIRRNGEGTLEQETWAMDLARAGGVPVPEVLFADPACDDADGRPVMVVAAARGRELTNALASASETDRHGLLVGVGEGLARLHAIAAPGVWRPGDDGSWPDPDDLRRWFIRDRRAEQAQLAAAGLTVAEVDRLMALLEVSPDPPRADFVLCHGDVSPEHIFVDDNARVSGLIDWGMWHGGSRLGDLAYAADTFGWPALDSILLGYGSVPPTRDSDLKRQLATTHAVQRIGHIAHHVNIGDPDGAARQVKTVRRALGILDSD